VQATRPDPSPALDRIARFWADRLEPDLAALAARALRDTLERTTFWEPEGTTFVLTGDIPAMWLRDSSLQVAAYLPYCREDPVLRRTVRGLIARQAQLICTDPYANAFNEAANGRQGFPQDLTAKNPWVFERKYEVDSLCFPVWLAARYVEATGDLAVVTPELVEAFATVRSVWRTEQAHDDSPYAFQRPGAGPSDTLARDGRGHPVGETGMTWSGFRPSDDSCRYGYLIPAEMFAVVALRAMARLLEAVGTGEAGAALALAAEIDAGIAAHGTVRHPEFGEIYAYEVDGRGNALLMDDANLPSLLGIPFFGYRDREDPVYRRTRAFCLSPANPYYAAGSAAAGIGSPHTPAGRVWPIALAVQAVTSADPAEKERLIQTMQRTAIGGAVHESFDPDDPRRYSREWFAWADTMFALAVMDRYGPSGPGDLPGA
jgi:hypothetical protein